MVYPDAAGGVGMDAHFRHCLKHLPVHMRLPQGRDALRPFRQRKGLRRQRAGGQGKLQMMALGQGI